MAATATFREKFDALTTEASRQWMQWASDIAGGLPSPQPRAILEAASVLDIDDPAEQLEADAAVIAEVARLEADAAVTADELTARLRPWGGSLERLDQAIAEGAKKVADLRAIRATWEWNQPDDLASAARNLRARNEHLFPAGAR